MTTSRPAACSTAFSLLATPGWYSTLARAPGWRRPGRPQASLNRSADLLPGQPGLEQAAQRGRRIRRCRVPGLALLVDAMAGGAHADLAGTEGDPVALAHDRAVVRRDQLPRHRPLSGHERGHRAIGCER